MADRTRFLPGPLEPLDLEALLAPDVDDPLAPFVSARLNDAEPAHARISAAMATMDDALASADVDTFLGAVDAASGSHTAHAQQGDDSFGPEIAAANSERGRLEAYAADLPPDGVDAPTVTETGGGGEFDGVAVDWEAISSGGFVYGGPAPQGGPPAPSVDTGPWKAQLAQWVREHFHREAEAGELADVDRVVAAHGTITQALFDQLIRENFATRL